MNRRLAAVGLAAGAASLMSRNASACVMPQQHTILFQGETALEVQSKLNAFIEEGNHIIQGVGLTGSDRYQRFYLLVAYTVPV